ncbi:MAG: anaerobic ribonucleoside-triphosphate reductase activating protein [Coriobacteriia bacterium]|nr:anaerobic ribonucleoside-triphosphate reductase activating protein [Coriobacteriia bacterium]
MTPTTTLAARVAAWQPVSMLDWPGRVAATAFISGCPFRCAYCHNPDLIAARPHGEEADALIEHLVSRRGWIDGVVITGGEPTSDPELVPLLETLNDIGIPVKLDTNGSRPETLARVLENGLVQMVALDVKTVPERYDALTGWPGSARAIDESIQVVLDSGVDHEFRTTAWPGALTVDDFPRIARRLERGRRYVIQQFRPEQTLRPEAADVLPFSPDTLRSIAALCNEHIPTVVRGAA